MSRSTEQIEYDPKPIEQWEEERQEAAYRVGTEQPLLVEYWPSFDAATAFLRRLNHESDQN